MRHKTVQRNLYDYIQGALSKENQSVIEAHLAHCSICSEELKSLLVMLQLLQPSSVNPSGARPEMYWQHFTDKVQRRISERVVEKSRPDVKEFIVSLLVHRKPFAWGFVSAVGMILIAFLVWKGFTQEVPQIQESVKPDNNGRNALPVAEARAYDYLERSKILIVGLVNVDPQVLRNSRIDFARQKKLSRELVRESHDLVMSLNAPSQQRLRLLVSELELILVQIASLESENNSPALEIVRTGVERNGILLKINLEEIQRGENTKSAKVNVQKNS